MPVPGTPPAWKGSGGGPSVGPVPEPAPRVREEQGQAPFRQGAKKSQSLFFPRNARSFADVTQQFVMAGLDPTIHVFEVVYFSNG